MSKQLRVVQWATGNIGGRALREVIRHPDLELVGLLVYDPAKDGVDAGELCGEGPVGVAATTDRAKVLAAGADCVLYMPRALDLQDVLDFLASGTNVVSTRGELFAGGQRLGDEARDQVLAACEKGGTSIYATGSSPGFITDALPLALLSMQRRVDGIQINEYANLSQRDSPHMIFQQMGYGQPVGDSVDQGRAKYLLGEFGPALSALAEAAGRPVDDWTSLGEVAAARDTTMLAAGELPAGTVGAQRTTLVGSSGGDEVIRFVASWYCTEDLVTGDVDWDLRPTGWRVQIHGDAPFDVQLPFPVTLEEMGEATPGYTANRPVNAVPYVCAAAPGILTTLDLPLITPAGPPATS